MASSRSEGSSASSRRTSPSPIPYRVGPLEYQPAVACRCGSKATRWISWSPDNLGHCYFKWFHLFTVAEWRLRFFCLGPTSSFLREVLNDLRDEVWKLKREKAELSAAVQERRSMESELDLARKELATSRNAVGEKEAIVGVLKDRNNRLELERFVMLLVVLGLVVVVVFAMLMDSHGGSMRIDPGVLAFLGGGGPPVFVFFAGS
uniref:Zinc finger GRF-type domain-containing protein n=1 Tax=Oryza meridionalis TaxID=40149 RepID=A0A0E0DQC5_9ORYZ